MFPLSHSLWGLVLARAQIATGKSTTLELLQREAGAVVLNADQFGHEAYLPGTKCQQELVAHFGAKILAADGTVDRKVL